MNHFRGTLDGARTSTAIKSGTKGSGLMAVAASHQGAIRVHLRHNEATGKDQYLIEEIEWQNQGRNRRLTDWTDFNAERPNFHLAT